MAPDPIIRGFILAAGFGTRLAPITDHVPKPLLPVGGATLLDHAVAAFDRAGIRDIAVNSHHLGSMVEDHVGGRSDASRFQLFHEKEIQGTGGALHGAKDFLAEADYFVVFNGDVLCDVDLSALIGVHIENQALATLLLVDRPEINTVHLDTDQSIIHIEGAGPLGETPADSRGLTYSGIGIFSRRILDDIGSGFSSLIAPLVRALADDPGCVKGFAPTDIFWDDLGTLPRLLRATQNITDDPDHYAWLQETPGSVTPPMHMTRITGHGSDRHFWRMATTGWSAIAMQSPADDEEFTRQLAIGKFLHENGLGSAQVYSADEEAKVLLMEDLGQASLYFLARNPGTPEAMLADRYRQVVDHLLKVQACTEVAMTECPLAVDRCLDEDVLLWETSYFRDNFLIGHLGMDRNDLENLTPEFEALATCVARQPLVLLHRDFQSQNIHFRDGRVRLVDIQGMRLGPLGYDIMSLVMDPYVDLKSEWQSELLERFADGCDLPPNETRYMQFGAGAQRLMQALGAYGFLGHQKGKTEFLKYIPQALVNLKYVLNQIQECSDSKSKWLPDSMGNLCGLDLPDQ